MISFLVGRLVAAATTVVLVMVAVFVIFFVIPGAPGHRPSDAYTSPVVVLLAGKRIQDHAYVERLQEELNLGLPLSKQFTRYVGNVLKGDLGYDYQTGAPVSDLIRTSLPASVSLVVGALVIWLPSSVVAAAYAARRRGSSAANALTLGAIASMSVPVFVTALLVTYFFSRRGIYLQTLHVPWDEGFAAHARSMLVPWLVLASAFFGKYYRFVRAGLFDVASEDFMKAAEAKGLSQIGLARHQLRATITSTVSLLSADLSLLFGGVVLVEPILGVPGLGNLLAGALFGLNFPIVAGVTLAGSLVVVLLSLATDVAYAALDPRVGPSGDRH